ncbi:MAG TPA: hypothetical protein VI685_20105 [Candidatus Angelobacter sp.]
MNHFRLIVVTTVAFALAVSAQQTSDPAAVLQRTGERLLADLARMPHYTCVQTVTRTYYAAKQAFHRPSCSALNAAHETQKHSLSVLGWDRLRLDVALVDGNSVYSWVGAPRFTDDTVDKLAGDGPLGSGDFGVFLHAILIRTTLKFQGEQIVDGRKLLEYSYDMPLNKSTYSVKTSGGWARTAYSGTLLLDPEAADIAKLTVRTAELPTDSPACQATSEVTYGRTSIHDRMILVPRETRLYTISKSGHESFSQTSFAYCREYASTSRLLFDSANGTGTPAATESALAEPLAVVPAGLHFQARITTSIDSDTAAAGDPIEAVLRSPIRDKNKTIIAPVGARLHGRLRNVKWWSEPAAHYQIAAQFESVEIGGRNVPLNAVLYPPLPATLMESTSSRLMPLKPDVLSLGGMFFFFQKDHLLLKQLDSEWITVAQQPASPEAEHQK